MEGRNVHSRRVATGFEVTERFKGAIPFDRLRSHLNGASCGFAFQIGVEYLVFAPDSGEVGLCASIQRVPIERPAGSEFVRWSDILKAWKAGNTDLSNPWIAGTHEDQCWLNTMTDVVDKASILYFRAYSRVTESGRLNEVKLSGYVQPGPISVQAGATEYQADWVESDNYRHGVHMLRGDDAAGLLRALATVDRIQVSGRDVESAEIDAVFSTANNGGAIDAMLKCLGAPNQHGGQSRNGP